MTKDQRIAAEAFAYCEAHCDSDEETALVHWIAEHLSDAYAREYPRFNVSAWRVVALPINARRVRTAVAQILRGSA
jgi:hypothetical protein